MTPASPRARDVKDKNDKKDKNSDDIAIATAIIMIRRLAPFCDTAINEGFGLKRAVAFVGHRMDDEQFDCIVSQGLQIWIIKHWLHSLEQIG